MSVVYKNIFQTFGCLFQFFTPNICGYGHFPSTLWNTQNQIKCLDILCIVFIFWLWLLYCGQMAENQWPIVGWAQLGPMRANRVQSGPIRANRGQSPPQPCTSPMYGAKSISSISTYISALSLETPVGKCRGASKKEENGFFSSQKLPKSNEGRIMRPA